MGYANLLIQPGSSPLKPNRYAVTPFYRFLSAVPNHGTFY